MGLWIDSCITDCLFDNCQLSTISSIFLRRFRLRDSSLEIFFSRGKHRNFFVDFGHTRENAKLRNDFARSIIAVAPAEAFKQSPSMVRSSLQYSDVTVAF